MNVPLNPILRSRALLAAVLETVRAGELWLGDHNFYTRGGFIEEAVSRHAVVVVVVREHEDLRWTPVEPMREGGRIASRRVTEQRVYLDAADGPKDLELHRRDKLSRSVAVYGGVRWIVGMAATAGSLPFCQALQY